MNRLDGRERERERDICSVEVFVCDVYTYKVCLCLMCRTQKCMHLHIYWANKYLTLCKNYGFIFRNFILHEFYNTGLKINLSKYIMTITDYYYNIRRILFLKSSSKMYASEDEYSFNKISWYYITALLCFFFNNLYT